MKLTDFLKPKIGSDIPEIDRRRGVSPEADVAGTQRAKEAFRDEKPGPKRDAFVEVVAPRPGHVALNTAGILESVDKIRSIHLEDLDTDEGRYDLRSAARSMAGLAKWLTSADGGLTQEPVEASTARAQVGARTDALKKAETVQRALKSLGWTDPTSQAALQTGAKYITTLRSDLKTLTDARDAALAGRPAPMRAADFADPRTAAHAIGTALGDAPLGERLSALAAGGDATVKQNITSLARLVDDVNQAPDYQALGMGWHHPGSRGEYRARGFDLWNKFASEPRRQAAAASLRETLGAAVQSADPSKAIERALVDTFVTQVGVDPQKSREWKPTAAGVRDAIDHEAFVPLRALNETVGQMAPKFPETRPQLRTVVDDITRHVLEGDYEQWRMSSPTSQAQLASLSEAQKEIWKGPTSIHSKGPNGVDLVTREEKGTELMWVTKIGGPSHGFDYGGHCLLPLLANARSTPILVQDPRWPQNAAARAYLRLLTFPGGPPVLYLEPMQRDFPHRDAMKRGPEDESFELALVRHAAAKAKAMGVSLSLSRSLWDVAREAGLTVEPVEQRYNLAPSGGVFEASDTLTHKHDWVQTHYEDTDPLRRLSVRPETIP